MLRVSCGFTFGTYDIEHEQRTKHTVEVEGHGRDTHGGEPNTHDGPGGQEEVQGTRVVERSILEDQTTKVSVGGNNVVSLLFLAKLVSVVGGFLFSGFTNQRRGNQGTVHGREERSTKDTGNTSHVEGVHKDVVLGLEDQHEVEGTANDRRVKVSWIIDPVSPQRQRDKNLRDSKGHTVREGALSNGVGKEDSSGSGDGSREGGKDPRTHAKTVTQFPFSSLELIEIC